TLIGDARAKMKYLKDILQEEDEGGLKKHPLSKMREYTDAEFPWEHREYTVHSYHRFPNTFRDADHFKQEYDKAPLKHLSHDELMNLGNSTVSSFLNKGESRADKIARADHMFDGHRDLDRIKEHLRTKVAPPIVLKHSKGHWILGGNTRLSMAAAHGIN